ncbi:O-antigen ligase family protein [Heliomicrobium undosum]|nr:O-antigen ligase family protein [Heliomicrobium undosum]
MTRFSSRRMGLEDIKYSMLLFMFSVYPFLANPAIQDYFEMRFFHLAVFSALALYVLFKEQVKIRHPLLIPLAAFLGFSLIATLLAADPKVAWTGSYRCTGYMTYVFCAVLFVLAYQTGRREKLLNGMFLAGVIVSTLAVLQFYGINLVPDSDLDGLVYSTMGNPNWLGAYLVLILPAAVIVSIRSSGWRSPAAAATLYAGLLVSNTRGAWIAFLVVFSWILVRHFHDPFQRKRIYIIMMIFLAITALLAFSKDGVLLSRAYSMKAEINDAVTLSNQAGSFRMLIWKEVLKLIPQHWAFGLGPDHLMYANIRMPNGMVQTKSHNFILEILITTGVFSLIAYLRFLGYFLMNWQSGEGFIYFAMILGYVLQGLFLHDVIMVVPLFWIILGFAASHLHSRPL